MCYALLWGVFLISCGQPGGKDQRVVSPDGTVAMQVYVADGHLGYTVAEEGTVVLDSSVLQWSVDSTLLGSAVSKLKGSLPVGFRTLSRFAGFMIVPGWIIPLPGSGLQGPVISL